MKVLVTGASGQLGMDLAPTLAHAGHDVVALRSSELDITDGSKVEGAIRAHRPHVVVNSAAYTRVDLAEKEAERAFKVNRDGAANLAESCERNGAALIHISTDFVFDGSRAIPYREEDGTNPLGVYGESKLAGEEEIKKRCERHYIIRTSWLYGVNGGNFVKTILKYSCEREVMRVVYDQAGTPTWTMDLSGAVAAVVNAVDGGDKSHGVYHYSNEGVASWYDFAHMIIEEGRKAGAPVKCRTLEPILTHEYPTPARRPAYSVFDKGKIKKTFSLTIPHWGVSLRDMISRLNGGENA